MTLRTHLGPRTPDTEALHAELDRLEAARAVALDDVLRIEPTYRRWISRKAIRAIATPDSAAALDRLLRRAVEEALALAVDYCADYARASPDEAEASHYDEQIYHSQSCIAAITADEVLCKVVGG